MDQEGKSLKEEKKKYNKVENLASSCVFAKHARLLRPAPALKRGHL